MVRAKEEATIEIPPTINAIAIRKGLLLKTYNRFMETTKRKDNQKTANS